MFNKPNDLTWKPGRQSPIESRIIKDLVLSGVNAVLVLDLIDNSLIVVTVSLLAVGRRFSPFVHAVIPSHRRDP